MVNFMPLIKGLAVEGVMRGLSSPPSTPAGLGLMLVSVVPAGVGIAFLGYSEFLFLQEFYSPEFASLLTAFTALTLSGILGWTGYHTFKREKSRPHSHNNEIISAIHSFIEDIAEDLEDPIRENPKVAVLLASIAGFVAADQISKHT